MRGVAKFNGAQLSELFLLTADKMKLSPAIARGRITNGPHAERFS